MLTTSQLRAARAILGISVEDLANVSGLSSDTIVVMEASAGTADPDVAAKLRRLFEAKGVVFVSAGQQDASGPGVRLHQQLPEEGIRPQNLNATNDD